MTFRGNNGLSLLIGLLAIGATHGQTIRTVSKDGLGDHSTIQEAVNRSKIGDIVEILDAAVYAEQVTIDSTRHGLILRSSNPTALIKPTIRWEDKANQGPRTCQEAITPGNSTFDQNGALRLIKARNVVIDGIGIDAVQALPFAWEGVWGNGVDCTTGQRFPLFHGNGGIALFLAGNATIRNCDIKNAYYGIAVKDRNEGGVFANVNPADLEKSNVVPLSGFGRAGGHVFEKNRIHHNVWGFYFESSWDLGSTARYNLIYENHHTTPASAAAVKAMVGGDGANHPGGGFLFKDVMLSPLAIYNNTFWKNKLFFAAGYRPGAQHLIFNNIYGQPHTLWGLDAVYGAADTPKLDPIFINRMKHSMYAAQLQAPAIESRPLRVQMQDPATNTPVIKDSTVKFFGYTPIMNGMGRVAQENFTVNLTLDLSTGPVVMSEVIQNATLPGGLILGTTPTEAFPAAANIRWFEMVFKSTDPASPDFLTPDWDDEIVKKHVLNGGWPEAGIYNSDGKVADLGAIPSTERHKDDVVIRPLSPVIISDGSATLNFDLSAVAGDLQSPKIKYIKLVRSIPVLLEGFGGAPLLVVPPPVDVTPGSTALKMGGNTITVTGIQPFAATENYAFFEIIAEGTGTNGQPATTNVGFLPYRKLDYKFVVEVLNAAGQPVKEVKAGEAVNLKITPQALNGTPFPNPITPVEVSLNSGSDLLTTATPPVKLALANVTGPTAREVMFTRVPQGGVEYVTVSGIYKSNSNTLAFYGVSAGVKILPADPEYLVFQNPPSKIHAPGTIPILDPGVLYPVKVEVRDRFDNKVSTPLPVSIKSNNPNIGDIEGPATATTDTLGIASFQAKVTNGDLNDIFELEASITGKDPDKADLKVGKPRDKLWILYADAPAFNASAELRGAAGERLPVTIRAGQDVNIKLADRQTEFRLDATIGLAVFPTLTAATPSSVFTLVDGETVVYVTGLRAVDNGALIATPTTDNTIKSGTRDKIFFTFTPSSVLLGSFHADNGFARVDRVEIRFRADLKKAPDSIALSWPAAGQNTRMVRTGITVDPADAKHVTVALPEGFPAGLSSGNGSGTVYTFDPLTPEIPPQASNFTGADSVGPLLDSALVQERLDGATGDTLIVGFNERITAASLRAGALVLIKQGSAPVTLSILSAVELPQRAGFRVAISDLGPQAPAEGDSLKINGAGPLVDSAGNLAHTDNRPVALRLKTVPKPVFLSVRMDKPYQTVTANAQAPGFLVLSPNPDLSWTPVRASLSNGQSADCAAGLPCGAPVTGDAEGVLDRPAFTVETDRAVKYSVTIFSNLGEFVNGFSGEITNHDLGLDERNLPVSGGSPIFRRNAKGRYAVKIAWNARAHDQSRAGTGAYIAKIQVSSQAENAQGRPYPVVDAKVVRFGMLRN